MCVTSRLTEDPDAFARYQVHHIQNYSHIVHVTFEPVFNLDAAFAQKWPLMNNAGRKRLGSRLCENLVQ